jgi:formylglycine-generating enzyme required for sulfatase activity
MMKYLAQEGNRGNPNRVFRGGSSHSDAMRIIASFRYDDIPSCSSYRIGFRPVRNAKERG